MFTIKQFSKLAKTTIKTLRYYDEENIFKPSFVQKNGYRYYSIDDLNRLIFILKLREIGLSISEIKKVNAGADLKTILYQRSVALENEIKENQKTNVLLKTMLKRIEKGESIMEKYLPKEIVLPETKVYYRHGIIEDYSKLFDFVLESGSMCKEINPTLICKDYCFITYVAQEYQDNQIELEYCEAVEDFGNSNDFIKFKTLPKTKAIEISHKGSYDNLQEAYAFAINYVKEKNYEISDKIREVYVHGCWDQENPDDYLTLIQIPVK